MRYLVYPKLKKVEYCKECGEPLTQWHDCRDKCGCGRHPQSMRKMNADEQVGARNEDDDP